MFEQQHKFNNLKFLKFNFLTFSIRYFTNNSLNISINNKNLKVLLFLQRLFREL